MTASLSARPLAADVLSECGYQSPKKQNLQSCRPAVLKDSASDSKTSRIGSFKFPELNSSSQEEEAFRAYFLAMAISNNHKMMMCALAEKLNLDIELKPVKEKINRAVKILASASLFLIGLESGGLTNKKEAMAFLFAALRVVERFASGPSVKELIHLFGNCNSEELNQVLCHQVALVFGIESPREKSIENFICSELTFRKEIAGYACRQNVGDLREQLMLFL